MNRYRALTLRHATLTGAEEAERIELALAGWHEALIPKLHWACERHPGEEDPPTPCEVCREEEALESLDMVTVADVLSDAEKQRKVTENGLRSDRIEAALDLDAA